MFGEPSATLPRDRIGDWVLRGGVAFAFLLIGLDKFPSGENEQWVRFYDQIGIGQWFRYFTGVIEIAGAALVAIPKTARFGLAILAATMAGASLIHIFVMHHPGNVIITGGPCLGLMAFWWSRRGN